LAAKDAKRGKEVLPEALEVVDGVSGQLEELGTLPSNTGIAIYDELLMNRGIGGVMGVGVLFCPLGSGQPMFPILAFHLLLARLLGKLIEHQGK
jgi:hypothetical protein